MGGHFKKGLSKAGFKEFLPLRGIFPKKMTKMTSVFFYFSPVNKKSKG